MVIITYDAADILKRVAARRGITFPLLADPGSRTIEAFGILNQEATGRAKGIPHPGVFILDRGGVIRAKLFIPGYKERHSSADIIRTLNEVPKD